MKNHNVDFSRLILSYTLFSGSSLSKAIFSQPHHDFWQLSWSMWISLKSLAKADLFLHVPSRNLVDRVSLQANKE
ncbi:unnamed protein product [Musa hybrid cultivar]